MSKKGHYLGGNQTIKVKNYFDLKDKKTWLFDREQKIERVLCANEVKRLVRLKAKEKRKLLNSRKTNCYD